jgi:hypothetical protein
MKVSSLALVIVAFLVSVTCQATDLTRARAKEAFERVVATYPQANAITLSTSQLERLKNVPPPAPPKQEGQAQPAATKKHGWLSHIVTVNGNDTASTPGNSNLARVFNLVYAPPQTTYSFADPTNHPAQFVDGGRWCLPDPSDMRIMTGNFIQCVNYVGTDIDWQHPGVVMILKQPVGWAVKEVTGITEGSIPSEKIVDITWQFDLSSFPPELKDAINQPALTGKILFKLYDDGWRFEKLIAFNQL